MNVSKEIYGLLEKLRKPTTTCITSQRIFNNIIKSKGILGLLDIN